MDTAYNQHSGHFKRNNRSAVNLNHLSLAPLTPKLPITDAEALPEANVYVRCAHDHHISYLEGRSAPTTPGILTRSSSRVSLRRPARDGLPKSKSSTHLSNKAAFQTISGVSTPRGRRRAYMKDGITLSTLGPADRSDSDWLLRAGALISSETRESKGQSWLVSRASSTSLTGNRDEDEEGIERALEWERDSRRASRRTSVAGGGGDADDEYSPIATRMSFIGGSRPTSRHGSRSNSRRGSKARLGVPLQMSDKEKGGYFDQEHLLAEPDFVDADGELYEDEQAGEDDVIIRRLAKKGTSGLGVWVENLMGWSLFSVEEDEEETDNETMEHAHTSEESSRSRLREKDNLYIHENAGENETVPPPGADEGGWQDAAWLLSVATKVLL